MKQIPDSWHYNVENFKVGEIVKVKSAEKLAECVDNYDTIFEFADLIGRIESVESWGMQVSGVEHSRIFGCFERITEETTNIKEMPDIDIYSLIAD